MKSNLSIKDADKNDLNKDFLKKNEEEADEKYDGELIEGLKHG